MLVKRAVLTFVAGEPPDFGQDAVHQCPPPDPSIGGTPPDNSGWPPSVPPDCRYVCLPRLPGSDGNQSGACDPILECP